MAKDTRALSTPYADLLPPLSTEEFDALKADIKERGVLHPVFKDEDGNVLDGHHRLKIDPDAPVIVIRGLSAAERMAFVYKSNFIRRNLSPSQKDEARRKMKTVAEQLRSEDPKRWTQAAVASVLGVAQQTVSEWFRTNTDNGNTSKPDARVKVPPIAAGKICERIEAGESQSQVAADYGVSQRAISSIVSKEKSRREIAPPTNNVEGDYGNYGYADIGPAKQVDTFEELAGQKFGTIYADPPWQYGNQATRAATSNHYDTLSIKALCELPVASIAADKSHLHLWTTSGFLRDAFTVIDAWGFEYKSHFIWVKPQLGIGNYWRLSHEILLLGVRGNLTFRDKSLKSWGEFPRSRHSEKPETVRSFIERASPGPCLELFGRKPVDGWTVFGNQIERRLFA